MADNIEPTTGAQTGVPTGSSVGSSIGAPMGESMREIQRQMPPRVGPGGNKMPGPRLAQPQRPQASGAGGTAGKAANGKGMKWAMGLAFGGSLAACGLTVYLIS